MIIMLQLLVNDGEAEKKGIKVRSEALAKGSSGMCMSLTLI